jgi:hypothetical protein
MPGIAGAIFVSPFEPAAVGHGGNHRAYQIVHDLKRLLGEDNVIVVSWLEWSRSLPEQAMGASRGEEARGSSRRATLPRSRPLSHLPRRIRSLSRRLSAAVTSEPIELVIGTGPTARRFSRPDFTQHYREALARVPRPAVCVMEHVGFADLLELNRTESIPTIACIQNLESFDTAAPLAGNDTRKAHLVSVDFAGELGVLARCDERLFISKVEAGLVGGLGICSQYYPYVPTGAIRESLIRIRHQRSETGKVQRGLFLMLGSAAHSSTWESFSWFIRNARDKGLPRQAHVVVSGHHTERLLPPRVSIPGVELRGWLDQAELDELLVSAEAVLIPQTMGLGAVTRLPELACAGIPMITSLHPTYAITVPPGVVAVQNDWPAWCRAMEVVCSDPTRSDWDDYLAWEVGQDNTLERVAHLLSLHPGT